MGYHIFLTMVLRARAPSARAELRYKLSNDVIYHNPLLSITNETDELV